MPRRYVPKPFNPRPLEPGATITWEHRTENGNVTRTGIVWSKAQKARNNLPGDAVWVNPDERLPGDQYAVIYVVTDRPAKYEPLPWSSDDENTWPGLRTLGAARAAGSTRMRNAHLTASLAS